MLPAEEVLEQRSELLDRTLDLDKTCRIALALLEQKPNARLCCKQHEPIW